MKKINIIFLVLALAVVITGCGQPEAGLESDLVNTPEAGEDVKVKPASIELEERDDEAVPVSEPAGPNPLEIDFSDLDVANQEVMEFEAAADVEVNKFKKLRDTDDRDLNL